MDKITDPIKAEHEDPVQIDTSLESTKDSQSPSLVKPFIKNEKNRINKITILSLLVLLSAAMIPIMKIFFVPIILATTFVTLFFPYYHFLLKLFKGKRAFASLVCCSTLLLCCIIPGYIAMHLVVKQLISFYQTAEPSLKNIMGHIAQNGFVLNFHNLPFIDNIELPSLDLAKFISESLKTFASFSSSAINKTSVGVFGFIADILIMFFTMFYFFMDGESLVRKLKFLSPIRDDYEDLIFSRFLLISRATVLGTVLIGLIQGALGSITLLVFGIKSWLLWGFVMIILSIIPVVGAWVILIPAGLIQMITGNIWNGVGIILVSVLIISNIDNLLRPRLVGKEAKLHDLVIFFSSLGGISVFGIMGFIIGPVLAALFISVLDIYSTEFESQLKIINDKND